jgi:sporulation protein YlmC with PRC-barrel domain
MAEAVEFTIGARASCSDGVCGEVSGVIVDPADRRVTHLVIEPGHRREVGRLVPAGLIDTTGGEIRLRCTLAGFAALDPAQETMIVEGGGSGTLGPGGMPAPAGIPHQASTFVEDVVPVGEMELEPGQPVHATDGEIGHVRGFRIDPGDQRVTHVLLREGHLWDRKDVAIPVSAVTGVENGIRLSLTKKQVGDLPPAG